MSRAFIQPDLMCSRKPIICFIHTPAANLKSCRLYLTKRWPVNNPPYSQLWLSSSGAHSNLRRNSRSLFTEAITSIPKALIPPVAFAGFFCSLWIYKCIMLVCFQNKIIYMPGLPPGARSEKIKTYSDQCAGIRWEEVPTNSLDGTGIMLVIGRPCEEDTSDHTASPLPRSSIVLLYFQG